MQKRELKEILLVYAKIRKEIASGARSVTIQLKRKKRSIQIPEWARALPVYIEEILQSEQDPIFSEMIKRSVLEGKSDRAVLQELPMSESSFYRQKRKFENKLYALYILVGYVSRNEILEEKITE